jgi:transposase
MQAHPKELRERIVAAAEKKTQTNAQLAVLFDVSERYIYKLLRKHRSGEDITPKGHGGGAVAKVTEAHLSKIKAFIQDSPDATLAEIQEFLRRRCRVTVSVSTVWRAVESTGMTLKKSRVVPAKPTPVNAKRS